MVAGATGKIPHCHAWLHRVGHQTVVAQFQRGDMRRLLERFLDRRLVLFDKAPVIAQVVFQIVVHLGRIRLQRVFHIHHGGQFRNVDLNRLGGIAGLRQRLGHNGGHRLAHVTHLAAGQNRMRRLLHDFAVFVGDLPTAGNAAHTFEIGSGKDFHNTRHPLSRRRVDLVDGSVRNVRAQEKHMGLSVQVDIVGIISLTRQKPDVLAPF